MGLRGRDGICANAYTFVKLYKTASSRAALVASGQDNPALLFLYGRLCGVHGAAVARRRDRGPREPGPGRASQVIQLSHRVLDISPFTHVPRLPGGTVSASPLLWLSVIAVALARAGLAGLRCRDIGGG